MEIKQVYNFVNDTTREILGKENLLQEDLSNVVEVGDEVFNANAVDKYVNALINRIGKVVFVNRKYEGRAPKVLMESWEFGSVKQKISGDLPVATENESWELQDGASYDPNIFYQPKVTAKFFNKAVTFEIPMSIANEQVKQSFGSADELNAFISMIYNEIDKSMTVKVDNLIMRTINNLTAETLLDEYPEGDYNEKSGVKAVNLLYMYNQQFNENLTKTEALTNKEFLRFASKEIGIYMDRLEVISTLFNIGGKARFTTKDLLHVVMLADFVKATDSYLESDTFHNEFVKLPNAETVAYWQGSGKGYSFGDISKINVKTASNSTAIELDGILCVLFDRDALGVTNYDKHVTSSYNAKAEFTNNWFKMKSEYFNDLNENFVVFFIQ